MRLPGKKILMVVAPEQFRDEELFVPRELFESLGARVTIASTRTGGARGMLGGNATVLAAIDHVRVDDNDAVLLIGGDGAAEHLWGHPRLRALVRQAHEAGTLLGAICLAPVVLASAGVVDGGEVAVWRSPEALAELAAAGVRPAAQDVVCAGRVITASGPQVADRWARAVVDALS
jgi:protease I